MIGKPKIGGGQQCSKYSKKCTSTSQNTLTKGFTLVELIITIIILAIIIAVTIGGIYSYIQKSRINTDINNANSIKKVLSTLSLDKELIQELNSLETNDVIGIEWVDKQQIKEGKLISNKRQARVDKHITPLFINKLGGLLVDGLPSSKTGEPFYITIEKINSNELTYNAFSKAETLENRNTEESTNISSIKIPTIVESHEHTLNEKIIKDATCTTAGSKEVKCTKCDYIETLQLDALGHNYSTTYTIDKQATCTEDGSKSQHCSRCDSKQNVTTIGSKGHTVVKGATKDIHEKCAVCQVVLSTSHNYSSAITTQATCTAKGTTRYTCVCGYNYTADDINALGHDYGDYKIDKEPTCTENGVKSQYCTRCNDRINITTIDALGHNYGDDGICTRCGEYQPAGLYDDNNNLIYSWDTLIQEGAIIVKNGSLRASSVFASSSCTVGYLLAGKLVISNDVRGLEYQAFYSCKNLESVIIPNSVRVINNQAFQYCYNLKSIFISDSVESIGYYVFRDCIRLEQVILSQNITMIPDYMFDGCYSLKTINIPSKVYYIGSYAFSGCSKLKTIQIPDSVATIGERAFYNCERLQTVTMSNNINYIGKHAFSCCSYISTLIIPNSITEIGEGAFYTVPHIEYHGSLSGAPWGAELMN